MGKENKRELANRGLYEKQPSEWKQVDIII